MAGKYQQLQSQIAKLQQEAAAVRKVEAAEAVATIKALIAEFDLTAEDLGFSTTKKATKVKAAGAPKYRDPVTGKTWTGRGKPPAWMAGPLKAGTAEALLIKTGVAPSGAIPKKPARSRKTAATTAAVPTTAKKRSAKAAPKAPPAQPASATKAVKRPRKKAGANPSSSAAPIPETPTPPAGEATA